VSTLFRFGILGLLLVVVDNRLIPVPSTKQRIAVATLLVSANQVVSIDELAEVVWDGRPPVSAASTLRTYFARVRRLLGPEAGARIVAHAPGYRLIVAPDELDVLDFADKHQQARRAAAAGQWAQCRDATAAAVALWRGDPLCDVPAPALHARVAHVLAERHLQVVELDMRAQVELGQPEQVVGELANLVVLHPLREHLVELAMVALYRCGRQAEAVELFRITRRLLVHELAVEPGIALQTLHQRMLAADKIWLHDLARQDPRDTP